MTTGRTFFIDCLRVVLTALVILHHTAINYGGSGGRFYREVRDGGTPTSLLLAIFCAVNQSFFMGIFFLLAGHFTLARKGVGYSCRTGCCAWASPCSSSASSSGHWPSLWPGCPPAVHGARSASALCRRAASWSARCSSPRR